MDRLHRHVGQLVGDVEVGVTDRAHMLDADQLGVAGREVVLLVDDPLAGARHHRELAEGDLAVPAVEGRHHALGALGVAGDDRHALGKVEPGKVVPDRLFHRTRLLILPAGEVDEDRIDAVSFQDQGRVCCKRQP